MEFKQRRSHRQLRGKWLVAVVVACVLYSLAQPWANQRLGWSLPTLTGQAATESSSSGRDADARPPAVSESAVSEIRQLAAAGSLQEVTENVFLSPAGLRYTPGSEQGHRLLHLARHLTDQADRPGKHGVFSGDMPQVLRWLDEAYDRGQQQAPGTTLRTERGRTIYEVDFEQAIGYVGGRDGKRDGNPPATHLRLVVDGERMITAFPF